MKSTYLLCGRRRVEAILRQAVVVPGVKRLLWLGLRVLNRLLVELVRLRAMVHLLLWLRVELRRANSSLRQR
jgi:hypothetical protein